MKHIHFDAKTDGFYGAYWQCKAPSNKAFIAMLGGEQLPYMPFCYQHPQYYRVMQEESKRLNSMTASRKLFDDSEAAHPIREEEFIKVENIKGKLLLIGGEDDTLWDTARYIRRMEQRLATHEHSCSVETAVYKHATHFVFPESLLKSVWKLNTNILINAVFPYSKPFGDECKEARIDIDGRITNAIKSWR